MQEAKWLSGEALQIAMKRREAKSKGEKESYKLVNAEFQRIARRDKKAFLSNQCKEIEEKNRMGKTSDLFKKIRDTKGTFHAKMGWVKDRNGMDLTEAEDIKNRWQEYTGELYKKDLHDQDNHDNVITHLEPDILQCEVKWALESITTNSISPFSLPFPLKIIILFSVSMSLSILITSYMWDCAALFAVAKMWKQPKYPSIDKRVKKIWCMYTVEYYSALKK